jgi:hypothetical protein
MISARALGILLEIASTGLQGGADTLSLHFKEGRDACQSALTELRKAGLIETKTNKFNGGFSRSIEVTELGFTFLESRISITLKSRTSILLSQPNSILSTNSLLANKQEIVPDGVGDEEFYKVDLKTGGEMDFLGQMDLDPDDREEQLRKGRERRKLDYQDAKQQKHDAMVATAENRLPAMWSTNQSSSEFIKRLEDMWHVKPWTVSQAPFRASLANARKAYDTDGEIEILMMDLYFKQIAHETSIDNPEHIWRRFIQQFSSLAIEAKRSRVTDDDIETEKIKAAKSWEGI